jgi:hypothetical protein
MQDNTSLSKYILIAQSNTTAYDFTLALQDFDFGVISVTQVLNKRPSSEGTTVTASLLLFLVTLSRCHKLQTFFTFTSLSHILIKVEAYRTQPGLTLCYI